MLTKIKNGLPLLALVLAVAASAFTGKEQKPATDPMYWFPTTSSGAIIDNTISISGHTSKPCDGDGDYCALGFTEQQVVVNNQDGTVTLKEEVDPEEGVPSLRE